ncbi:hypothetical protein CC80DRAFT_379672, partial [Byssothecium circinans]
KETVRDCSLRYLYIGPLNKWDRFSEGVSKFYNSGELQKALDRCKIIGVDLDDRIRHKWKAFATLEHTKIGAEIGLHGRFMATATTKVQAVIKTLLDPAYGADSKREALPVLPNKFACGDAKIVNIEVRRSMETEPDIVFTMPDTGEGKKVPLIGEVKSCSTYNISDHHKDFTSQRSQSIRNLLGQIARDMRERGIRFGFITTYKETLYLKISKQPQNGEYALYYSNIIKHTDAVAQGSKSGALTSISVRLAILYLLHRVSEKDTSTWSFKPEKIDT